MAEYQRVKVGGDLFHPILPAGSVYVGRRGPRLAKSPFSNPFRLKVALARGHDLRVYLERGLLSVTTVSADFLSESVNDLLYPLTPAVATAAYREWLHDRPTLLAKARERLAGKDLACWCPLPAPGEPDNCHAAVLLSIANPKPEPHDILPRHRTPETRDADGRRHITVQRCCNGCGEQIGDVTMIEMELAIGGEPLPDVRPECPRCRPTMEPPLAVVGKGESARLEAHDD